MLPQASSLPTFPASTLVMIDELSLAPNNHRKPSLHYGSLLVLYTL